MDVAPRPGGWPSGRVLAIEPSSATHAALRHALTLDRLTQGEAFPVALSDQPGTMRLYHHERDPSQHSFAAIGGQFETVRVATVDEFVREQSITRLDAMKIDVEGAEELVLRGAADTLGARRPIVVFEVVPGFAERLGLGTEGPINLLRELGYEILELDDAGIERPLDSFDVGRHPVGVNLIARHRGR